VIKKHKKIPDLYLERYLLDELPLDKKDEVEQALAIDSELQHRLNELKKSNITILEAHPAEQVVNEIERRTCLYNKKNTKSFYSSPSFRLGLVSTFSIFFVVALLQVFPLNIMHDSRNMITEEPGIRLKGLAPKILLYRKGVINLEQVANGSIVDKNELLQVAYVPAGYQYGVIFSVDGRGIVTTHFSGSPPHAALSPKLENKGENFLNYSYELDDAPKFERFFLVVSDQDFKVSLVISKAEELAENLDKAMTEKLSLPARFIQSSVIVFKHD